MKHFEEGLPNQFILFSQTPKAQDHGRALFVRFSIFLIVSNNTIGMHCSIFQNVFDSAIYIFHCLY